MNFANNTHWGWAGKKKIYWLLFVLHSSVFNVSPWLSKFIGELLLCKLGPRLPSGCDQNWEARTTMGQCLGHQEKPTTSSFHVESLSRAQEVPSGVRLQVQQGGGATSTASHWLWSQTKCCSAPGKQQLRVTLAIQLSAKKEKQHLCSEVPISDGKQ